VGRFASVTISGPDADRVEDDVDDDGGYAFRVPADWNGLLTIYLGRPARAGEFYMASSDAFAVGEPLHCSDVLGQPLRRVVGDLEDDFTLRVGPAPEGGIGNASLTLEEGLRYHGDWFVSMGMLVAPDELIVVVQPFAPPPQEGCEDDDDG
jgi:hypothetical protein